ncbi:MAG: hypothetical protein HXS50_01280 [Theionarchaea archaeon]|nr:hypothetical protein [Theionarchaea archaeon]
MGRLIWSTILLLIVVLMLAPGAAENRSLKVRVFGSGQVGGMNVLTRWFTAEPSTDPLIIPTREFGTVTPEVIRRMMRLYFPRTREELLTYDFFFLACVDMGFFSDRQQSWIRDGLDNYQKGGINTRSVQGKYDGEWRDSMLDEPFPNDAEAVLADPHLKHGKVGPMVIVDDPDLPAIMSPFKDRLEPLFVAYRDASPILLTIPRQGAVILSYTENNAGIGYPVPGQLAHVFYWRWEKSITFTFRDMVTSPFWNEGGVADPNVYALDIIANIIWFSTGRELPTDPFRVHEFRMDLYNFGLRKSLLVSLLEFTEKFGALPNKEYKELSEIESTQMDASDAYLRGEYDRAHDTIGEALLGLDELEQVAMVLKDKTLFWVYVVEWSITTSTMLMAGVVVWALMVKRAMYREVGATRSSMMQ